MNRKHLAIAVAALLLCAAVVWASADDTLTKEERYRTGITYLSYLSAEEVEKSIPYFESAGSYGQAKRFVLYAQALGEIFAAEEDGNNLTLARMRLEMLDVPEFAAELEAYDLPGVSDLQVYIRARRYEIDGKYDEAMEAYGTIENTLDALYRRMDIAINKNDMIYQKAMELFGAEDYIAAAKLFQELNDWKDSAAMYGKSMALHRHEWVAATCMTPKTCTACGATEGSPLGHDWKAATCTEPKTCTRCGQTEGKALGHNWQAATCTEPKTCQRCGLTEGKGQNHDWKAATCTEPKTCRRCGLTEGKALGHNWRAATCTEPKTCTRCGAIEGKALGHAWKAATCTESKTCTRCGRTEGAALGHNWKAATCTEPRICSRCGKTEGKALGHDWLEATYTAPKTCKLCGITEGTKLSLPNGTEFGGLIDFGHYEQDGDTANGKEPIEWIILDVDEDNHRVLLISKYGLDAKPFEDSHTFGKNTWATCTLRKWLNENFLSAAFTPEEQEYILLTLVANDKTQGYDGFYADGGIDTQDRVFLLSYKEAEKYFGVQYKSIDGASNNTRSRVSPTVYAVKNGADVMSQYRTEEGTAAGWWWLRSPGSYQERGARVYCDGCLMLRDKNAASGCVRPAMWLSLDADIY